MDLLLVVCSAESQGRVQTAQVKFLIGHFKFPELSCANIFWLMNPNIQDVSLRKLERQVFV